MSHILQTSGLGPINAARSLQSLLSIIASGTLHAVGLSCVRALRAPTWGLLLLHNMVSTNAVRRLPYSTCNLNAVWYSKDCQERFGLLTDDRWDDSFVSVPSKGMDKTAQSSAYKCTGRGVGLLVGNGRLARPWLHLIAGASRVWQGA